MSEYISENVSMSDTTSKFDRTRITENSDEVSQSKSWVQFDEKDGNSVDETPKSLSAGGTPTRNAGSSGQSTTSGVSSARGSVNSLSQPKSPEGAELSVSEIQVKGG